MQLCKCLNYFLKTHNKQLNQYCLNFNIFYQKIKDLKNSSSHRSGRVDPQKKKKFGSRVNPFLLRGKKIQGWVGSGQEILTHFALSTFLGSDL